MLSCRRPGSLTVMCSGSGKSGAKPPVKRGYPGDTCLAQTRSGLSAIEGRNHEPTSHGTKTKQEENPGRSRQRAMRVGSKTACFTAQLTTHTRHDTARRHDTRFRSQSSNPHRATTQERYTILDCGMCLTQRKSTTRIAHNYFASNTRGMMPRLNFPMRRCLVSSVIRPSSFRPKLRSRQMGLCPAPIVCTSPACSEFI